MSGITTVQTSYVDLRLASSRHGLQFRCNIGVFTGVGVFMDLSGDSAYDFKTGPISPAYRASIRIGQVLHLLINIVALFRLGASQSYYLCKQQYGWEVRPWS